MISLTNSCREGPSSPPGRIGDLGGLVAFMLGTEGRGTPARAAEPTGADAVRAPKDGGGGVESETSDKSSELLEASDKPPPARRLRLDSLFIFLAAASTAIWDDVAPTAALGGGFEERECELCESVPPLDDIIALTFFCFSSIDDEESFIIAFT